MADQDNTCPLCHDELPPDKDDRSLRSACQYVWAATHRRANSIDDITKHLITTHEELVDAHKTIAVLQRALIRRSQDCQN